MSVIQNRKKYVKPYCEVFFILLFTTFADHCEIYGVFKYSEFSEILDAHTCPRRNNNNFNFYAQNSLRFDRNSRKKSHLKATTLAY